MRTLKRKATSRSKVIPLPKLLQKTERIFNAWVRKRDDGLPCISCGRYRDDIQAGHFVPVKNSSFLRFHEWNVNGECSGCNGFDGFHLIGYRKHLIHKIGEDAVRYLEDNKRETKKWTRQELEEICNKYK